MSEVIVSPGVFQIESDQSLYTQAPQTLGAAIVGPTVGGLPFVPTYVTTYNQYLSIFGDVFKSGSYYYEYLTSMAAREYFSNGGQTLLVTRVISGSGGVSTYAQSDVPNNTAATPGTSATASWTVIGSDTGSWFSTVINATTALGTVSYTINNYPYYTPGTNFSQGDNTLYVGMGDGAGNANVTLTQWANAMTGAINTATNNIGTYFTSSYTGGVLKITSKVTGTIGNNYSVTHSYYPYSNTAVGVQFSQGIDGTSANSFTLEALAWGNQMNNTGSEVNGALASGSSSNVRWEVTNSDTTNGTFTIVVRRGDDNQSQKNILETWANVSLDPQQSNYISRVIGDFKPVYVAAAGGNSAYVNFTGDYANASRYIRVASVTTPNVDSIDNNGNFKSGSFGNTLPVIGSGSYGGSFSGGVADTAAAKLMNEAITTSNIQGFTSADYNLAFDLLTNRDEYQFNVLMAPGIGLDATAASTMISTVEGRGDAIAILGAGVYGTTITQATTNAAGQSSNYAACYYPWIQLYSGNLGKTVWCPPSTVIGGVLAFNDQVGAEWFAPAGLNRGGVPSVVRAERR